MSSQVFVPITDDIIYNHPEQIEGPLVPYSAGLECHNWLTIELNPDQSEAYREPVNRSGRESRPSLRLAYSATY